MKKLNKTYATGILAILFAGWIVWQAGSISNKLVSNEPGPRMFPYIAAAGIVICAVLSMIFDGPKEAQQEKRPYLDKAGWVRLGIIFGEFILLALGMHFLGLLIAGSVMMFVFIMTLKRDKKVNIPFALCLSVGLSCLVYFGFTRVFHMVMPTGVLWDMLGIDLPF